MARSRVKVMGVLNVTPDSFFDGGKYTHISAAVEQAIKMEAAGASIIDVGGESTRPGAMQVHTIEELDRVIPVIRALRQQSNIQISIDTSKPQVMQEAVSAGANIINDVCALRQPGALEMAVELDVPVCLMHMLGEPRSMQNDPQYENVVTVVASFLKNRVDCCLSAGIHEHNIWLDPGFGFGKTLDHNLSLLKHLKQLTDEKFPILVGVSRKSMLSTLLNIEPEQRLVGSLALATIAIVQGASIIRVHDVDETVQIVNVCEAVMQAI